jgi:cytoskeletal protein RodZ
MADDQQKGYILKEVRESKGISLETVHEEIKIPMDALKAIEEGYTIRTLSSFYLKGFIKMYAQYLGVDVTKVIEEHHPEKLPEPIKNVSPAPEDLFKERLQNFLSKQKKQEVLRWTVAVVALLLLIKLGSVLIHRWTAGKKDVKVTETVKKAEPPATAQRQEPPPQAQARTRQVVTLPAEPADEKKNIALSVRARKDSWLRVETDGNVVFQAVLKEWTTETWRANQKIEISGKNISQLEFELNGKLIGALGREDRQARKVIVTRNGLSVEK